MRDFITQLSHRELEGCIEEYREELPKCNPLQRDCLRSYMRDAYKRMIREGRYSSHLLSEIVRHRNSGFSADYTAEQLSKDYICVYNVQSASWADTQSEAKQAEKDLVKLVKDLFPLVDKEDVKDESHLKRIAQLVK